MKKGDEYNPIEVYSDDEKEQQVIKRKFEDELSEQRIMEALLTGSSFDLALAIVKSVIAGDEQQKNHTIRKKIIDYFRQYAAIDISCGHFSPKHQPNYSDPDAQPMPNQLILFGVDFLSVTAIRNKFSETDPSIVWINESNCKLIFGSAGEALQAISKNVLDPTRFETKVEQDDDELPRGWFTLKPYNQLGFQRSLICRYATTLEEYFQKSHQPSKFINYEQAKEKFQKWLLKEFKVENKFEHITRKDEEQKVRGRTNFKRRFPDRLSLNSSVEPYRRRKFQNRAQTLPRRQSLNRFNTPFSDLNGQNTSFDYLEQPKESQANMSIDLRQDKFQSQEPHEIIRQSFGTVEGENALKKNAKDGLSFFLNQSEDANLSNQSIHADQILNCSGSEKSFKQNLNSAEVKDQPNMSFDRREEKKEGENSAQNKSKSVNKSEKPKEEDTSFVI